MHGTITRTHPGDTPSPFSQTAQNTAIALDVDDCLVASTVRQLEEWKKNVLWNLHTLTNGAVILVTNSDMRSIDEMMPGFPCVSEHASVFRLTQNALAENRAPALPVKDLFDAASGIAAARGIAITVSADDLHGEKPILKLEEKMASLAMVFGKHACYRDEAVAIAAVLEKDFNLAKSHAVTVGRDAVEIAPKGFEKANALESIMAHPNFFGRSLLVFGDSAPDERMMEIAFAHYNGKGYPVGDCIPGRPFIARRFRDKDHLWTALGAAERSLRLYNRFVL